MPSFGLFKINNTNAVNIFNRFCPNYYLIIEHKEASQEQLILLHFKKVVNAAVWNTLRHLTPLSRQEFFNDIYPALKLLSEKKKLHNVNLLDIAFLSGNTFFIDVVLQLNNVPHDRSTVEDAVLCCNLKSLKHLEIMGFTVDASTMQYAAWQGCLPVIKYCVGKGYIPTIDTLEWAALTGDMPTLRYLIEKWKIQPTLQVLDSTILGANERSHHNKAANRYIFALLFSKQENKCESSPRITSA